MIGVILSLNELNCNQSRIRLIKILFHQLDPLNILNLILHELGGLTNHKKCFEFVGSIATFDPNLIELTYFFTVRLK